MAGVPFSRAVAAVAGIAFGHFLIGIFGWFGAIVAAAVVLLFLGSLAGGAVK